MLFTKTKQQHSSNMNQKKDLLWQFTVKVIESKSGSHWHNERPNVCTEVTLEIAFLTDHQITSDFGEQHWTISGNNLNAVWSWKKNAHPWKHYTTIIKLYTSSIQYFLQCQWLLSLSRYSQQFYGKCCSLQSQWECHSRLSWSVNSQNPSWYSLLKSISILSSYIHTGLLNGLFPPCFPINNLFKITFIPMHATFLTHCVWYPTYLTSSTNYETPHYASFSSQFLSSVQTLFSSFCSQTTCL